jgi:hypothetical protein
MDDAKVRLDQAEQVVAFADQRAQPTRERVEAVRRVIKNEHDSTRDTLEKWDGHDLRLESSSRTMEALDTWLRWAAGGELSLDRAVEVLDVLREEQHVFVLVLAGQLDEWIRLQPVGPPTPRRQPHVLESPALELPR